MMKSEAKSESAAPPATGPLFLFEDRFATHDSDDGPCNWQTQNHSSLAHIHGRVSARGFELYTSGGRHLPIIPPVRDFCFEAEWVLATALSTRVSLDLLFDYDPIRQVGRGLRFEWEGETLRVSCGEIRRREFRSLEVQEAGIAPLAVDCMQRLQVEREGGSVRVTVDSASPFCFELGKGEAFAGGSLAIERGSFPGYVVLRSVRIEAQIASEPLTVWEHELEFPPGIHGMNIPLRYALILRQMGNIHELRVKLSGGALEKPEVADFEYQGRVVDRLVRPYLRLLSGGGERIHYLHGGTQILGTVPGAFFYQGLYPPPEWPLERVFYFERYDPTSLIRLGYEDFLCSASRALGGGPAEMLFDPSAGVIVHAGGALARGRIDLEITSPSDDNIRQRIPAHDPRYQDALAFCANNHFFSKGVPCSFRATVRFENLDIQPGELGLEWRLEDVFRDPLGPAGTIGRKPGVANPGAPPGEAVCGWCECPQPAGLQGYAGAIDLPQDLAPGVYHLQTVLNFGGQQITSLRKAFEIMPEEPNSPPPPLLSGLPVLFSSSTETMGLDTDPFDPWRGIGNDAAHYTAICCFFPEFARKNKIWDTVHLYGRKWFCWLTSRTTPRHTIDENRDILAHVDFVNLAADAKRYHLYLWKSHLYRGIVLEVFHRFLRDIGREPVAGGASPKSANQRSVGVSPASLDESGQDAHAPVAGVSPALAGKRAGRPRSLEEASLDFSETRPVAGEFTEEHFRTLVLPNWNAWVEYFCRWLCLERLPEQKRALEELNPAIRRSDYGPVNGYCSSNKTAYSMRYRGLDPALGLDQFYNGFFLFEDYPFACGYAIHAKTFTLACLKLADPRLVYYPELYAPSVQGSPDSAVMMGNPPFGIYGFPALALRKRIFEYAFGVVWHGAAGFHYWLDDGFHTRNWKLELYHELLDAWKFVRGHRAVTPLRCTAFVVSMESSLEHPETYRPPVPPDPGSDVFNAAEECVPFAYDMARRANLQAGFAASMDSLAALDPREVDLLVLPPLRGVPAEQVAAIRRLHAAGVNLLGFESIDGLEDLFGVERLPTKKRVAAIRTAHGWDFPERPAEEVCEHGRCQTEIQAVRARVLLDDGNGASVLTVNETPTGKAALWAVAPTLVRRDNFCERDVHGRENISALVETATRRVLAWLGDAAVTTSEGKVTGFRDDRGVAHIVVSEDAHPHPAQTIRPLVKIRLSEIPDAEIRCDRPFQLVASDAGCAAVRLVLEPHECAVISVEPTGGGARTPGR